MSLQTATAMPNIMPNIKREIDSFLYLLRNADP